MAIRSAKSIPGAIITGLNMIHESRGEGSNIIERGVSRRKGVGECPKGGGVPGNMELARSPARCETGT